MFGFKKKINRDLAAATFMSHCRTGADHLRAAVVEVLRSYCDGLEGRPTLGQVVSRPLLAYEDGKLHRKPRMLLDAHCYAIVLAAGIVTLRENIDPPSQVDVVGATIHRLIVEEDVGKDNIGRPPPPQLPGDVYFVRVPGSLVGGVPSIQQRLTWRYTPLGSRQEQLAMLLLSLRVLRTAAGIRRVVYEEFKINETLTGRNEIGTVQATPDEVDEWNKDLIFRDPMLTLSELPDVVVRGGVNALERIDPFWPAYCRRHRLTW